VDWVDVLGGSDVEGRTLEFIHDDVLAPGVSIGVHAHGKGEEYYYIVCGDGTMTLDGERFPVTNGSVTAVFAGGAHGLENTGTRDLRVIVIGIR
jgi:mannose-6-phosphate isomerase-like protein (cupin superfamily)